ncbi:MAG: hypothetical protein ABIJ09_01290 [Pseudomonadota bacterium]
MRQLFPLVVLGLVACGGSDVGLAVNVVISPAWGSQIDRVELADIAGDSTARACSTVLAVADSLADCSIFSGFIPTGTPCSHESWQLSSDPGSAGETLHLTTGEHTLAALASDAQGQFLDEDCARVTVTEGKTSEVTFTF